ncbi:hypothetical protein UA45_21795 [Morganella morganii]|uniref:Uncharacterized protein n=1 Tax=Morganella morganii TaxID=582 RepID=A0A0D8L2B6_MORMO|nr:hypothetical protein UA45_21795 [Morganella morganii]
MAETRDISGLRKFSVLQEHLRGMLEDHRRLTGSARADALLRDWTEQAGRFILVKPKSADIHALAGVTRHADTELRIRAQ